MRDSTKFLIMAVLVTLAVALFNYLAVHALQYELYPLAGE